jgi:hypothetical protein
MLAFDSYVSITICTRTHPGKEGLDRWTDLFARIFGCFTQVDQTGGWIGPKVIEREPNRSIGTWGPDWKMVERMLRLAQWLQRIEQQESIFITWTTQGTGAQARGIFEGEWQNLEQELHGVFDPVWKEEQNGLALCRYFGSLGDGETSQGCDHSDHHW